MLVLLHVLAARFLFSRVLPGRAYWPSLGSAEALNPEAAQVDKGHSHPIFPVKAGELF
jgi:hypothetical protein